MKKIITMVLVSLMLFSIITPITSAAEKDTVQFSRLTILDDATGYITTKKDLPSGENIPSKIVLSYNDVLVLTPGTNATLRKGSAKLAYSDGTVQYTKSSREISVFSNISRNNDLSFENPRFPKTRAVIVATSAAELWVIGTYKVVKSQVTGFVLRLYENILDAEADDNGVKYWVDGLENGRMTPESVVRSFFASDVYIARKNITNRNYVDILYKAIYGRNADVDGRDYWVTRLTMGYTRQSVLEAFLATEEFKKVTEKYGIAASAEATVTNGKQLFLMHIYLNALDRRADKFGAEVFLGKLQLGVITGSEIAHDIIFSTEMAERRLNNKQFVEMMYIVMCGRPFDEDGRDYWVYQLALGIPRTTVFSNFASSQEFKQLCEQFGVRP